MTDHTQFDISQSADNIVALLNQGKATEAMTAWQALRADKPPVMQEALDRLIATRGNEAIENLRLSSDYTAAERIATAPMLDQFNSAKNAPRMPDTSETVGLTTTQKYDIYASVTQTRGTSAAHQALTNGQQVILGMRQETPTTVNNGQGLYDDRLIVIGTDAKGNRYAEEFNQANTEPTAQYDAHYKNSRNVIYRHAEGNDVNSDRISDMGRLSSNITIEMIKAEHGTDKHFSLRPSSDAVDDFGQGKVQRDTNGDGSFNGDDIRGIHNLNNTFKIHRGSKTNTDSAGCQTIHPNDYPRFTNLVQDSQKRWQYVLTETNPHPEIDKTVDLDKDVERAMTEKFAALTTLKGELENATDPTQRTALAEKIATAEKEITTLESTRQELLTYQKAQLAEEKTNVPEKITAINERMAHTAVFANAVTEGKTPAEITELATKAGIDITLEGPLKTALEQKSFNLGTVAGRKHMQEILADQGHLPHRLDGVWNSDLKNGLIAYYPTLINAAETEAERTRLTKELAAIEKLPVNPNTVGTGLGKISYDEKTIEHMATARLTHLADETTKDLTAERTALEARPKDIDQTITAMEARQPDPFTRAQVELETNMATLDQKVTAIDQSRGELAELSKELSAPKAEIPTTEAEVPASPYETHKETLQAHGVYIPLSKEQFDKVPVGGLKEGAEIRQGQQFLFDRGYYGDKTQDEAITGKWNQNVDGRATHEFQKDYRDMQIKNGVPEDQAMKVDDIKGKEGIGVPGKEFRAAMNHEVYVKDATPEQITQAITARSGVLDSEKTVLTAEKTALTEKGEQLEAGQKLLGVTPKIEVSTPDLSSRLPGMEMFYRLYDTIGHPEGRAAVVEEIRNSELGQKFYAGIAAIKETRDQELQRAQELAQEKQQQIPELQPMRRQGPSLGF